MEKKETWKPIDGYEGRYSISNFGQVNILQLFERKQPLNITL